MFGTGGEGIYYGAPSEFPIEDAYAAFAIVKPAGIVPCSAVDTRHHFPHSFVFEAALYVLELLDLCLVETTPNCLTPFGEPPPSVTYFSEESFPWVKWC